MTSKAFLQKIVKKNQQLLRETRSRRLLEKLIKNGHGDFLYRWLKTGRSSHNKAHKKAQLRDLLKCDQQLNFFFKDYFVKGKGIVGYLDMCQQLLREFRQGYNNSLENSLFLPPTTDLRDAFQEKNLPLVNSSKKKIIQAEDLACRHLDKLGMVLVAGGLGERLGSRVAKVNLKIHHLNHPKVADDSFLGFYLNTVIALQKLYTERTAKVIEIPLFIMCSEHNQESVKKEVKSYYRLGIYSRQVTVALQLEAPCIENLEGSLAIDEEGDRLIKKPLGHGFVHALISRKGYLDCSAMRGKEYLFFLQDTNPQSVNVLLSSYGLTRKLGYFMSWVGVERYPGEQAGIIVGKKVKKGEKSRNKSKNDNRQVINIEYNRLEAGMNLPQGQFFANTNNFWIRMREYRQTLKSNDGVLPFIVNPKIASDKSFCSESHLHQSKSYKPFRPESLMQDIARTLPSFTKENPRAGIFLYPRHLAFSPLKRPLKKSLIKEEKQGNNKNLVWGDVTYTSLELELNNNRGNLDRVRRNNTIIDCQVKGIPEVLVPLFQYPKIVFDPIFTLSQRYLYNHIKDCVFHPQSLLMVKGSNIYLNNLTLQKNAALIIYLNPLYRIRLSIDDLTISNVGLSYTPILQLSELNKGRDSQGYRISWKRPLVIKIDKGGNYRYGKNGLERE